MQAAEVQTDAIAFLEIEIFSNLIDPDVCGVGVIAPEAHVEIVIVVQETQLGPLLRGFAGDADAAA